MASDEAVQSHYQRQALIDAIRQALEASGKDPDRLTVDDLGPVDEFHIGGREASLRLLERLRPTAGDHLLDVGSGLGGAARLTADRFGCRVSGVDLTPDFVAAARTLSAWVGLADRLDLRAASALDMPFADNGFDHGYMMHVGMNIEAKDALFAEIARVLKPGARFAVYDIMAIGGGELDYPVPWANTPATSFVAPPEVYRRALAAAGFELLEETPRGDFALDFFAAQRRRFEAAGGPPRLGLHVLMGPETATKIQNMVANIAAGRLAPVEMIARLG
jgi:SAM-dependent methyltransferase